MCYRDRAAWIWTHVLFRSSPLCKHSCSFLLSQENKGASNILQTSIGQTTTNDTSIREQIAAAADYLHSVDTSTISDTILLNGVTLQSGEPLLLYDSTPFASKGHLAMNVPCNKNTPENAMFEILFGRSPNLSPVKPGYLPQISAPPNNCIYISCTVWFWRPCTDIAIRYIGENQTRLHLEALIHW